MKKFALAIVLLGLSNLSFAGGCWNNGKYQQCPKNTDTPSQQSSVL